MIDRPQGILGKVVPTRGTHRTDCLLPVVTQTNKQTKKCELSFTDKISLKIWTSSDNKDGTMASLSAPWHKGLLIDTQQRHAGC